MYELTCLAAELTYVRWALAHSRNSLAKDHLSAARKHYDAIMAEGNVYASGKWAGWYTYNRYNFRKLGETLEELESGR